MKDFGVVKNGQKKLHFPLRGNWISQEVCGFARPSWGMSGRRCSSRARQCAPHTCSCRSSRCSRHFAPSTWRWAAPEPTTGHQFFLPDTLLSIFDSVSCRGRRRWFSLVGRRDERAARWGGAMERSILPFPFIVPYERGLGHKSGRALKKYI